MKQSSNFSILNQNSSKGSSPLILSKKHWRESDDSDRSNWIQFSVFAIKLLTTLKYVRSTRELSLKSVDMGLETRLFGANYFFRPCLTVFNSQKLIGCNGGFSIIVAKFCVSVVACSASRPKSSDPCKISIPDRSRDMFSVG